MHMRPNVLEALERCPSGDCHGGNGAQKGHESKQAIFHRSEFPTYQPLTMD
jgi:hypothetical protein